MIEQNVKKIEKERLKELTLQMMSFNYNTRANENYGKQEQKNNLRSKLEKQIRVGKA